MTQRYTDTTSQSVAWFRKSNEEGRLTLRAPFQRNPVWSPRQRGSLVDTILQGFPIPEIYMQDNVDETGEQQYVIVDGQQRIRSILEYIAGDFPVFEENSRWTGLFFDDLSLEDKKRFFSYSFLIRRLPEAPEEILRAIFLRINRNTVSLNQQELRHATYWGPFISLMEDLADLEPWEAFGIFSANDRRRMLDVEFISELAVAYLNGFQNKKAKLEDYYKIYEKDFVDEDLLIKVFSAVSGEIKQVLPNLREMRARKKSDFYTLFLALTRYLPQFPLDKGRRDTLAAKLDEFYLQVDGILYGKKALAEPLDFWGETVEDGSLDDGRQNNGTFDGFDSLFDCAWVYAKNVDRAASDLGPRRSRDKALAWLLVGVLGEPRSMAQAIAAGAGGKRLPRLSSYLT